MIVNILGVLLLTGEDARNFRDRAAILKDFADRAERDAKNLLGVADQLQKTGQEIPTTEKEEN